MKRFFLFFIALVFFVACNDNDESPKGEYSSGVFIVNEGNFGSADGSISFYDPASGSTKHDIFGLVNNNLALGDVVQSMTIDGDLAYIVVNNSNKVEVVNANTFVSEYRLNEVKLPRYFVVHAGKGYLTEWVSFSEQGRVAVVDLNSRTIATRITTDFGAENLVVQNNKLYVSNSFTNTVSVIDLAANAVIKTIEVGSSPGRFVVDKNNRLWVVSAGGYDPNYNPLNDGALYRINTSTDVVEKVVPLQTNVSGKIAINKSGDVIYYMKGKNIFALSVESATAPAQALIAESQATGFYGIAFNPAEEILYVADAKGFASNGTVYRYRADGTLVNTFTAGRGTNGFAFK